jgi:hypothetical protein
MKKTLYYVVDNVFFMGTIWYNVFFMGTTAWYNVFFMGTTT